MLQGEHSAILWTFIKLQFVIKIFVLSIFTWPLKTGLTVFEKLIGLSILADIIMNLYANDFSCQNGGSIKDSTK